MFLACIDKLFYGLENGVYYNLGVDYKRYDPVEGKECAKIDIPIFISGELDRMQNRHNEILEMDGKIVNVSYEKEHGFFISYYGKDQRVYLDPTFMS